LYSGSLALGLSVIKHTLAQGFHCLIVFVSVLAQSK
jgi:hypothetical protein